MPTPSKSVPKARPKAAAAAAPVAVVQRSMAGRMVHLSDPEMKPAMDAIKLRIQNDPAYALSLLQSAGIATPGGKLTKRFGG